MPWIYWFIVLETDMLIQSLYMNISAEELMTMIFKNMSSVLEWATIHDSWKEKDKSTLITDTTI